MDVFKHVRSVLGGNKSGKKSTERKMVYNTSIEGEYSELVMFGFCIGFDFRQLFKNFNGVWWLLKDNKDLEMLHGLLGVYERLKEEHVSVEDIQNMYFLVFCADL